MCVSEGQRVENTIEKNPKVEIAELVVALVERCCMCLRLRFISSSFKIACRSSYRSHRPCMVDGCCSLKGASTPS